MGSEYTIGDYLGVSTNYTDETPLANEQSTILGVTITFCALSWICVVLRFYTRFVIVKSPGWDDLFVGLYLLTTTSGSVALMVSTRFGLGRHLYSLTPANASLYLMCFYIMNASYTISTACIKLSLLFQYLRVFQRGTAIWRLSAGLAVFTFIWGAAYSFLAWFPCFPVNASWAIPKPETATCFAFGSEDSVAFAGTFESHAAINMVLDLLVLAIPLPLYFEKATPARMRMSLLGLFFMGAIVNLLSIWRLVTVIEHKAATYPEKDPTWYAPISLILAAMEIDIASICASVPVFWPVLQRQLGRIFVTQEVQVTREARWTNGSMDDRWGLTGRPGYGHSHGHGRGQHGSNASDAELNKFDSPPFETNHYEEAYVMGRWDPIMGAGNAKATVQAEGNSGRRRWWRLI